MKPGFTRIMVTIKSYLYFRDVLLGFYLAGLACGIFAAVMMCCAVVELVKLPDVVEAAQGLGVK
jgi:hypothetical protein